LSDATFVPTLQSEEPELFGGLGMPANTLRDKRKPIKRSLKTELREFLRQRGESETESKDKIEEYEKQIGDLKTEEQRSKRAEIFPLYTEDY